MAEHLPPLSSGFQGGVDSPGVPPSMVLQLDRNYSLTHAVLNEGVYASADSDSPYTQKAVCAPNCKGPPRLLGADGSQLVPLAQGDRQKGLEVGHLRTSRGLLF